MRRVEHQCPCGGVIYQSLVATSVENPDQVELYPLTCSKCDAIFVHAPQFVLVKVGRDDGVIEGSLSRLTTQVIYDERTQRTDAPTVR